jgi:hypothetical protein
MGQMIAAFAVGDVVRGQVQETLGGGDLIVSFQGDLLRLDNRTGRQFWAGDWVFLRVAGANPLRFRLHEPSRGRDGGRFDILA